MAYIQYNAANTAGGNAVWEVVDKTLHAWYRVQRIKAEMDSLIGAGPDYTKLETPFGIAAGTGLAFYTAVVNLKANLDSTCGSLKDLDRIA